MSKTISQKNRGLSTYEGVPRNIDGSIQMEALSQPKTLYYQNRPRKFKIFVGAKDYHTIQQKGMLKIMGMDYVIHYRNGKENKAADALSRRGIEDGAILAFSGAVPESVIEVTKSYQADEECKKLINNLILEPTGKEPYTYNQELIKYKDCFYIGFRGT